MQNLSAVRHSLIHTVTSAAWREKMSCSFAFRTRGKSTQRRLLHLSREVLRLAPRCQLSHLGVALSGFPKGWWVLSIRKMQFVANKNQMKTMKLSSNALFSVLNCRGFGDVREHLMGSGSKRFPRCLQGGGISHLCVPESHWGLHLPLQKVHTAMRGNSYRSR